MKILIWNVNGVQARLEAIKQRAAELTPDLMCFRKVRKKGTFLTQIPGCMGWLGIMDDGLLCGVSTYIKAGFAFDFEAQRNDRPEWRMERGGMMSEELLPYLNNSEILTDVPDTTDSPLLIEIDYLNTYEMEEALTKYL